MRIAVFVFSLLLLVETPAEAYVDPGTGSMLIQLLIGGAMAGLVLFRAGLRRMIGWFRRPSRGDSQHVMDTSGSSDRRRRLGPP